MSTLIVDINEVGEVLPHNNADSLEIINAKGWQCCVRKGEFKPFDKYVYFPPDSVLPKELGERLGVWKYTSNGKVKAIRLRGEPSYGFCVPLHALPEVIESFGNISNIKIGDNVAEILRATKYEPPITSTAGAEADHPAFHKYTDIESYGNFPNLIDYNEEVLVSEKLHGSNCRIGLVEGQWMAGSHNLRRKEPEDYSKDLYWYPLSISNVKDTIEKIYKEKNAKSVILFGEIYGRVQTLKYGLGDRIAFSAFDMSIDGKYLDWKEFKDYMENTVDFGVATVPIIMEGKFGDIVDKIGLDKLASGNTLILDMGCNKVNHIREGIVVKPIVERMDPKVGRVILKHKNVEYLAGNFE